MRRLILTVEFLVILSVSATAGAATATPTGSATPPGTPTATPAGTAASVLIAIDNLVARGSTDFVTNFDAFTAGTVAEDLTVPGMTFTADPPGSWQIADAAGEPFGVSFRTLSGEILL